MTKQTSNGIINPFSEKFLETWLMWKAYKKDAFGFEYKGIYSEQMTLKVLTELSEGDEDKAIRIVEQSVMRQWQGFFPLHIPSTNGKSKQKKSGTGNKQPVNQQPGALRDSVQAALDKRNGNCQQRGSEPYLKAV